jgi:hypothetical protein
MTSNIATGSRIKTDYAAAVTLANYNNNNNNNDNNDVLNNNDNNINNKNNIDNHSNFGAGSDSCIQHDGGNLDSFGGIYPDMQDFEIDLFMLQKGYGYDLLDMK